MKPFLFKKKLKWRRRDRRTKKVGVVLCDYCGSTRFEDKEGHDDSLSMESQLKGLRLLNRRWTGMDLQGLSFPELKKLITHLQEAVLIVDEEISQRPEQAEVMAGKNAPLSTFTSSQDDQVPPVFDEVQSLLRMQVEHDRQRAESPSVELERLLLWKERMSCRGLSDMTFSELCLLASLMRNGLMRIRDDYLIWV